MHVTHLLSWFTLRLFVCRNDDVAIIYMLRKLVISHAIFWQLECVLEMTLSDYHIKF